MTEHDLLRRFMFEDIGVRGLWVKLSQSWLATKKHQPCNESVEMQLGEALTAVVLLSATIKFNGSLILQAQGSGPLQTLVAQATHDRKIRGLIKHNNLVKKGSLEQMFGDGKLAITISANSHQSYQGVVPLEGYNLASALEAYFTQSEQLSTRLWLFADDNRAAGLLLQELPSDLSNKNDWDRVTLLADTITENELLELDCEHLLFRLFNEESVRIFQGEPITYECTCSRAKIENALRIVGHDELKTLLKERHQIEVNCEFCNKLYRYDTIDIEQLFLSDNSKTSYSKTRH
jgi:molecular chaperone Hsp33